MVNFCREIHWISLLLRYRKSHWLFLFVLRFAIERATGSFFRAEAVICQFTDHYSQFTDHTVSLGNTSSTR